MLEYFELISRFIQIFILFPLPFALLLIFLIDKTWSSYSFTFTYKIIRIILVVNWGFLLLELIFNYSFFIQFISRATGLYWWLYLMTTLGALLFPILLFHKKWRYKKWILFMVTFLSTIGKSFEYYIVLITSLHQDYFQSALGNYSVPFGRIFMRPIILAVCLIIFDLIVKKSKGNSTEEDILD